MPSHSTSTTGARTTSRAEIARNVEAARSLARLARRLERASADLSLAHYRVLSAVASGEERASRVAERLELGRPAISATVEALCRNGHLERRAVHDDQRAFDLRVSASGRAALIEAEDAMIGVLTDVAGRTSAPSATLDVLAALGPALDSLATERDRRRRERRS